MIDQIETVMKENEIKMLKDCRLTVRYNKEEIKQLNRLFKATTCSKLSEYVRKISLHKPVTIHYRNKTADEFLSEMILLKNELHGIANNFNQAVHKMHTMDTISELKSWAILNESLKNNFLKKTDEIKEKLNTIHQLWSQK